MKKSIKLTPEQVKSIYTTADEAIKTLLENNFPELKPKPIVPDKWEDLDKISGYYISPVGNIYECTSYIDVFTYCNKNIFTTKKQAKSALAYAQLTQLMKATGDCDVDWSSFDKAKYCIRRINNNLNVDFYKNTFGFLAFNTKSACEEFLKKHIDLIKQFYQLD